MSDTAISSQVSLEANTSKTALAKADSSDVTKSQASDFDDVLGEELDNAQQSPENNITHALVNLEALLKANPLLNNTTSTLSLANGKSLPGQLSVDDILLKNAKANLAQNMPLEGEYRASAGLVNLASNPQAKVAIESGMNFSAGIAVGSSDDEILSSQISSLFTDKNLPNIKQLNAQLFSQLMNKVASMPQPVVDSSTQASAMPSFIVSQSLSVQSSEAILPPITVSPSNPQWNSQLGERINWMINNTMQRADIRLDPPELGNLDIRLKIAKDNQASILIHVSNAGAKEAIESAIPRLREMFEQQGLNLANVDVSQQNLSQQQSPFEQFNEDDSNHQGQNNSSAKSAGDDYSDDGELAITNISSIVNDNLVDIFA